MNMKWASLLVVVIALVPMLVQGLADFSCIVPSAHYKVTKTIILHGAASENYRHPSKRLRRWRSSKRHRHRHSNKRLPEPTLFRVNSGTIVSHMAIMKMACPAMHYFSVENLPSFLYFKCQQGSWIEEGNYKIEDALTCISRPVKPGHCVVPYTDQKVMKAIIQRPSYPKANEDRHNAKSGKDLDSSEHRFVGVQSGEIVRQSTKIGMACPAMHHFNVESRTTLLYFVCSEESWFGLGNSKIEDALTCFSNSEMPVYCTVPNTDDNVMKTVFFSDAREQEEISIRVQSGEIVPQQIAIKMACPATHHFIVDDYTRLLSFVCQKEGWVAMGSFKIEEALACLPNPAISASCTLPEIQGNEVSIEIYDADRRVWRAWSSVQSRRVSFQTRIQITCPGNYILDIPGQVSELQWQCGENGWMGMKIPDPLQCIQRICTLPETQGNGVSTEIFDERSKRFLARSSVKSQHVYSKTIIRITCPAYHILNVDGFPKTETWICGEHGWSGKKIPDPLQCSLTSCSVPNFTNLIVKVKRCSGSGNYEWEPVSADTFCKSKALLSVECPANHYLIFNPPNNKTLHWIETKCLNTGKWEDDRIYMSPECVPGAGPHKKP